MKRKLKQLNLFDIVDVSTEENFWNEFKKVVEKLKKQGFKSIDESWWRSRYFDEVVKPKSNYTNGEWERVQEATKSWKFIWNNNKNLITKSI